MTVLPLRPSDDALIESFRRRLLNGLRELHAKGMHDLAVLIAPVERVDPETPEAAVWHSRTPAHLWERARLVNAIREDECVVPFELAYAAGPGRAWAVIDDGTTFRVASPPFIEYQT